MLFTASKPLSSRQDGKSNGATGLLQSFKLAEGDGDAAEVLWSPAAVDTFILRTTSRQLFSGKRHKSSLEAVEGCRPGSASAGQPQLFTLTQALSFGVWVFLPLLLAFLFVPHASLLPDVFAGQLPPCLAFDHESNFSVLTCPDLPTPCSCLEPARVAPSLGFGEAHHGGLGRLRRSLLF